MVVSQKGHRERSLDIPTSSWATSSRRVAVKAVILEFAREPIRPSATAQVTPVHHPALIGDNRQLELIYPERVRPDSLRPRRIAPGGLKFHCWRQISFNDRSSSGDQNKTNSCVRATSGSMKSNQMRRNFCGLSKISLIVCGPGCAACHPDSVPASRADSMGCVGSSEVTSTWAKRSRSSQSWSGSGESLVTRPTTRLQHGHTLIDVEHECSGHDAGWPRKLDAQFATASHHERQGGNSGSLASMRSSIAIRMVARVFSACLPSRSRQW